MEKPARITRPDFDALAEFINREAKRRKQCRDKLGVTRTWAEIDRQIAMRPDVSHKMDMRGRPVPQRAWMPEVELPLQAQTLEVLVADARRMIFPDGGDWFAASGLMSDAILRELESTSLIAGEENDVPSKITQDNLDKLIGGVMTDWHRQYDFEGHVDRINAEAFRYSLGCARVRRVKKRVVRSQQGDVYAREMLLPVLIPRSIKHVYPDDREHIAMSEGEITAPLVIECHKKSLLDLKEAARKGSKDPEQDVGGWMPAGLQGLEPDKNGMVETIEAEGDFIIERARRPPLVLHNCCVEIACSAGKQSVFRLRWVDEPSYLFFPYHFEDASSVYATSPLMKGWPIQKAASDALMRLMIAGAMNATPPVEYDSSDTKLASAGGPELYPGANLGTVGKINPLKVGDPGALSAVYTQLLMQYSDVTGVNAPRLGAQTISHTTAYSKQVEIARGEVRTVDFVKAMLRGPLTAYLGIAWRMGLAKMNGTQKLYIESFGGYVDNLSRKMLPQEVAWKAIGAAGPQEEAQKRANKLAAVQLAIQVDQAAKEAGQDTGLDLNNVIYSILRDGGWTDVDALIKQQPAGEPAAGPPAVDPAAPAIPGAGGLPGAVPATVPSLETLGVGG